MKGGCGGCGDDDDDDDEDEDEDDESGKDRNSSGMGGMELILAGLAARRKHPAEGGAATMYALVTVVPMFLLARAPISSRVALPLYRLSGLVRGTLIDLPFMLTVAELGFGVFVCGLAEAELRMLVSVVMMMARKRRWRLDTDTGLRVCHMVCDR